MKDAKGHGSDGRSGGTDRIKSAGLRGLGIAHGVQFNPRYRDAQHTVEALRAQMRNTGPGHQSALWQGIKNLIGA